MHGPNSCGRPERPPSMSAMTISSTASLVRLRLAVLAAILLVASALLAGCSAGGYTDSAGAPMEAYAPADYDAEPGGELAAGDGPGAYADSSRALIVTGSLYMTVDDPIAAADAAAGIVQAAGGRIDARSERSPDEWYGGSAALTLRIPAATLEAVVDELRALGTVDEYTTNAVDVTTEVRDLDARISTLRASTERIEALLTQAEDISDIIQLEDELARRQAELESLEARQRGLDDEVSYSTIYLSLTTEPVVFVDDAPKTFLDGLKAGWDGLVSFLSWALVALGVLLPWLVLIGIVVAAIVWIAKSRRRARAERAASVAAGVAGAGTGGGAGSVAAAPTLPPSAKVAPVEPAAPTKPAPKKPTPKKPRT